MSKQKYILRHAVRVKRHSTTVEKLEKTVCIALIALSPNKSI